MVDTKAVVASVVATASVSLVLFQRFGSLRVWCEDIARHVTEATGWGMPQDMCGSGQPTTKLADWPELQALRYVADEQEPGAAEPSVIFVSPASFHAYFLVTPIWFKFKVDEQQQSSDAANQQWFWKPYGHLHGDGTWIPVGRCRLLVSKPVLKAPIVLHLETKIW